MSATERFTGLLVEIKLFRFSSCSSQRWEGRGKLQTVVPTQMRGPPATACPASRAAPTARTTLPAWHERTAPFAWPCFPSSASACWLSSLAWCSCTTFAGIRSVRTITFTYRLWGWSHHKNHFCLLGNLLSSSKLKVGDPRGNRVRHRFDSQLRHDISDQFDAFWAVWSSKPCRSISQWVHMGGGGGHNKAL